MTSIAAESNTGIPFAVAALEVRERTLATLAASVDQMRAKVAKATEDLANAKAALVAAENALSAEESDEAVAAFEQVCLEGTAYENRSDEDRAAEAVAAAQAALETALEAQASIGKGA